MKKTLFIRIFGGYVLVVLALGLLVLVFSHVFEKKFHIKTLTQELEDLGRTLEPEVIRLYEQNNFSQLDFYVKKLGEKINTRITVIDLKGVVVADSDSNPETMENHRFRPEIIKAYTGETGQSVRLSKTVKNKMLYIGLPLKIKEKISGVLRLSLYFKEINLWFSNLRKNIAFFVLILIALSLFASYFFSRNISKPIQKLRDAAQRTASGELKAQVFLKQNGELKELAESFNSMTERISQLFNDLKTQKEQLICILQTMEEGLVTLDINGKIIFCNDNFKIIIKNKTPEGKFYWEFIRAPEFKDIFSKIKTEHKTQIKEIPIHERIYLCSANYLKTRNEMVITFHEITEKKSLEKIKKDFVINVSHELRTPLTSIKGYLETIEGLDKTQQKYLDTAKRNTDRLIKIVKDLLLISEIEAHEFELKKESVDIKELLLRIIQIFKSTIEQKNLKLKVEVEKNLPKVKGDPFELEQAFINLIDNAVKYTEEGTIEISAQRKNSKIDILIHDSGIGIPHQDLPRIFERFYVVDKSRSKEVGGTGLGLSIVKHIIQMHNGTVTVESKLGVGTTFFISLPVEKIDPPSYDII
jgi:two-component system, OmpR family, phosphate regulon sensor histidine kinase PhoR